MKNRVCLSEVTIFKQNIAIQKFENMRLKLSKRRNKIKQGHISPHKGKNIYFWDLNILSLGQKSRGVYEDQYAIDLSKVSILTFT